MEKKKKRKPKLWEAKQMLIFHQLSRKLTEKEISETDWVQGCYLRRCLFQSSDHIRKPKLWERKLTENEIDWVQGCYLRRCLFESSDHIRSYISLTHVHKSKNFERIHARPQALKNYCSYMKYFYSVANN